MQLCKRKKTEKEEKKQKKNKEKKKKKVWSKSNYKSATAPLNCCVYASFYPSNHHQLFIFKESNRTKDKNFKITEPTDFFTIKELTSVENLYHVELNKISKSSPVILVHELFTLLLP